MARPRRRTLSFRTRDTKLNRDVAMVGESHRSTYSVLMKNVTLALDETTLRDARRIAAERSTSLNALIRDFLDRLTASESRARKARRRIGALCRQSRAVVGKRGWTRDDLHAR